ncbi:MAG TPA: hypothetical protein VJH70_01845 [Candidatus Paceibacterota bacterium]
MAIKKLTDVTRNSDELARENYEKPYEPISYSPTPMTPQSNKKSHPYLIWIIALVILAGAWRGLNWFGFLPSSSFPAINHAKLQAVFLNNGIIYFGTLREVNHSYISIEEGYSIQNDTSKNQQGLNLVKLTDELHRPENKIYIPKTQISFWENLSNDSPVTKLIRDKK